MINSLANVIAAAARTRNFALALFLVSPFAFIGCPGGSNPGPNAAKTATPAGNPASSSPFDGERALAHVRKQVEFGPRPAGSVQLEQTRNYIIDELKSYGLTVTTEEFQATTPSGVKRMVNVTAELPGASREVIILGSHYDTKQFNQFRFVGANDGGSSTGALLELARVMAPTKAERKFTYWFVFFDGEEAFCAGWDDCSKPQAPDNTYGSRHYVEELKKRSELTRVRAMILMDLVGYTNLQFGRDEVSSTWLLDIVWKTAKDLGHGSVFVNRHEGVGGDDHTPFLKEGIDALDIIQLNSYKSASGEEYWHTPHDTLDKISAKSLKIVGDVVFASLPKIEQRLANKR